MSVFFLSRKVKKNVKENSIGFSFRTKRERESEKGVLVVEKEEEGKKGIENENGIPFHKINELEIRLMIMGFGVCVPRNTNRKGEVQEINSPQLLVCRPMIHIPTQSLDLLSQQSHQCLCYPLRF